jgi:hypothetical protein
MLSTLLFSAIVGQYHPIKFEEIKKIKIKKIEVYSEVTTWLWVVDENVDTVIGGVTVFRYEFDRKLLAVPKIEEHYIEDPVCGYGCMRDAGLMVINDKFLVDVPCGFQDDSSMSLLFFPKEKKCVQYDIKADARKYLLSKEKIIPTKKMMPEYRKMRKVSLKTE